MMYHDIGAYRDAPAGLRIQRRDRQHRRLKSPAGDTARRFLSSIGSMFGVSPVGASYRRRAGPSARCASVRSCRKGG